MTSYTDVFTGSPVQPSDVSYYAYSISADKTLEWPSITPNTTNPFARIMDITPSTTGLNLIFPDAVKVSPGMDTLVRNLGADTFTVQDSAGATITTVASGVSKYIYLKTNSTSAGTWGAITFGTGTSSADAAALAGAGLIALSTLLNQNYVVSTKNSNYTLAANDRATVVEWTGGSGTFAFTAAGTLTAGWFALIKNGGSGTLTLDPASAETIDGSSTLQFNPNEAAIVICDGTNFITVGRGRDLSDTFTRLVLSVAGSANVTLTSTQASFDVQEYTGILTGNISVIVPTAVNRWYVYNNTTGAFSLTVKTAPGTGIIVTQGTRTILYCDGTNVVRAIDINSGTVTSVGTGTGLTGGPITTIGTIVLANTAATPGAYTILGGTVDAQGRMTATTERSPVIATQGGTGQTTVTQGDLLYGSAADTWSKLAKNTSATRYLSNTGASNNAAWAQVDLSNGVTSTLPGSSVSYDPNASQQLTATDTSQKGVDVALITFCNGNILCPHKGLTVVQASATTVTVTASNLILFNSAGYGRKFSTVSQTPAITTSGAGGLDTGAEANSTWYHVWIIAKQDGTQSAIFSLSATAPTMPATYVFKGYVGAVYNNSSGNFDPMFQRGTLATCSSSLNPVLNAGTQTSYTAVSLAGVVPTTAVSVLLQIASSKTSGTATTFTQVSSDGSSTNPLYDNSLVRSAVDANEYFSQTEILMTTPQQVKYFVFGTNASGSIAVNGWRF